MKKLAVFMAVALLISATGIVYAGSSRKTGSSRGIPQGQGKIYDSHGQLQQTMKRDSSGNQNVYDKHGQLQGYVKPDGVIMNSHGQKIGEIKPTK
jgi:hypothetical protein